MSTADILLDMFNRPSKTTQVRILSFDRNLQHFLELHFRRRQSS